MVGRRRRRALAAALLRVVVVWVVSTLTLLTLAALLPDFKLQSENGDRVISTAMNAAWTAGVFGLVSTLVWPVLVRALLLVPAIVLGLLVFFLNGSLLLIALDFALSRAASKPGPETALIVAAVMSAAASATSAALAARDDNAFRRRLYRLAEHQRRHRLTHACGTALPGMVFLQLDGVGYEVLRRAAEDGHMPTVAAWLNGANGGHRLTRWHTDWSSQTGASQLALLHGSNHDVPAFRWYEKDTGRLIVSNRPASAAVLQRRAMERTGDGGLLTLDGASRGNLFSGGADQVALVLSVSARRKSHNRSRSGYFAYFSDPANAVRTAASFVAEVCRELGQSARARFRRETPRVSRGGLYPIVRAFATVVEHDVVVAAVMGDLLAGRTAVYADLVAYDEVAHHSGPHSRDAAKVLMRLDQSIALIATVATHAPRPYRIVLLSDHGQSAGETFAGRYGLTLKDLVRAGCGLPLSRGARRTRSGDEARASLRNALHRTVEDEKDEERPVRASEPVVLASGNLGLISFPDMPGRVSREEIDRRHPALLPMLACHPGIGFLLVRSELHGSVVLGPGGHEIPVGELTDDGPLAVFGPGAAAAVRRTDSFPNVADIMVNSMYDPATGEVHAFEEQIGSHGGLGGEQSYAFLLFPTTLSPPVDDGRELAGAEGVHQVLRRWLAECRRPQAPRGAVQESLAGRQAEEALSVTDRVVPDEHG